MQLILKLRSFFISHLVVGIWLTCLCPGASNAEAATDLSYILVLDTYNGSDVWSDNAMSLLTQYAVADEHPIQVEHLSLFLLDTEEKLNLRRAQLFSKYKERPQVVVFLGTGAWSLMRDTVHAHWPDVPMIAWCAYHTVGSVQAFMLNREGQARDIQVPLIQTLAGYNASAVVCPFNIRETLALMKRLLPGLDSVLFVSDQRNTSLNVRTQVQRTVADDFPSLHIQYLTAGEYTTDQLFAAMQGRDAQRTAILFFSWIVKETFLGDSFLSNKLHLSINGLSHLPLFSVYDIGVRTGYTIGGCYNDPQKVQDKLYPLLDAAFAGKSLREMPVDTVRECFNYLNYMLLQRSGIDPVRYPTQAIYFHQPPGFVEQNRVLLIVLGVVLICACMLTLYFLNRSKRRMKKQELKWLSQYRDLFNNMPLPYIREQLVYDSAGTFVRVQVLNANVAFDERIAVLTKEKRWDVASCMGEMYTSHLAAIRKALTTQETCAYEYASTGTPVRYYNVLVVPTSQHTIVDIFFMDITDIRHFQMHLESYSHKLAMALDAADMVPWRYNVAEGTITYESGVDMAGGEPAGLHRITLAEYYDQIHPDYREDVQKAFAELCAGKVRKIRKEYRLNTKQNIFEKTAWEEIQIMVDTYGEDGLPETLIGSTVCITERKVLEYELRRAKEQAEQSNKLKSAFLANMSHEIRTPLNAIVGFSNILAACEEDPQKKEFVDIIESNNAVLLQLINDILDLAKIEAGTLDFVYTYVDINGVLQDIEQAFRLKNKLPHVKIAFTQRMSSCVTRTDKNRLTQLLDNLIGNAMKFTQAGDITFGYTLRTDKTLLFFVQDTGCGIPKDKQADIFGRFVKLDSFVQGTGLGLSICEMIVSQMKGEIGVESEQGKGSRFWFTLPFEPEEKPEVGVPSFVGESADCTLRKQDVTLLVAEDNASNYKLFESILGTQYKLIHAWNGCEAVDLYRKYKPQLILMDIKMPLMNGYEATARIREVSATVPILAVTAFAFAEDEQRILSSGFDAYTTKPVYPRKLREQVRLLLSRYRIVE